MRWHRAIWSSRNIGDGLNHLHPTPHPSKDNVLPIQMRHRRERDEELRAIRIATRVCHREQSGDAMAPRAPLEALVRKLPSVDGLASTAVAHREIARLQDLVGNDSVYAASLVVEGRRAERGGAAALASAERSKILHTFTRPNSGETWITCAVTGGHKLVSRERTLASEKEESVTYGEERKMGVVWHMGGNVGMRMMGEKIVGVWRSGGGVEVWRMGGHMGVWPYGRTNGSVAYWFF